MPTSAEWRAAIRRRWPLLWRALLAIGLITGIVALWQVYNLEDYTDIGLLLELGERFRSHPLAGPITVALFVGAGIAFLPLTVMVVATIILFGPIDGFVIAATGTAATALVDYLIGWMLGADPLRRLGGPTLQRLDAQAGQHGVLIIAALRILPVAHFHAVSVLAGASSIGAWRYLSGTLVGTVPGIAVIALVGNQAKQFLLDPDALGLIVLTVIGVVSLGLFQLLRRWMRRLSKIDPENSR